MRPPAGIYVHLPFCQRHCFYCSFPVSAGRRPAARQRYWSLLLREIDLWAAWWHGENSVATDLGLPCPGWAEGRGQEGEGFVSLYLGGGTPTLYSGEELAGLIQTIRRLLPVEATAEIAVEANPGTVTRPQLQQLVAAGVNRLSLGVQARQDDLLARLGRGHTSAQTEAAVEVAREAGVPSLNLDLMFGLPGQSLAQWEETLRWAVALRPDHLSCYSLIVEEETPLAGWLASGRLPPLPSEDEGLAQYELARQLLGEAGYVQYEISNFARPGQESRHNLLYWHYDNWLAFGVGAAAHWDSFRWRNLSDLLGYEAAMAAGQFPLAEVRPLTRHEQMEEMVLMGLRLREGVGEEEFRRRFGCSLHQVFGTALDRLETGGFVQWRPGGRLALTDKGLPVGNQVFTEFLLD
ncbi:MAG: radical SAM family heme chaperone HemW [Limnochordaceae bacterium]|nr:radical SAM family heme chaperone HemW [Limnochordaceae bacterium]